MTALTASERETRLSMVGDDHTQWDVYTDDPMWIDRLDRITTAIRTQGEGKRQFSAAGVFYCLAAILGIDKICIV